MSNLSNELAAGRLLAGSHIYMSLWQKVVI